MARDATAYYQSIQSAVARHAFRYPCTAKAQRKLVRCVYFVLSVTADKEL